MHKDRLILLLLFTGFLFAACDLPWDDDDEEERRPQRASAANPLLRHYFNTATFPSRMSPIKIPEGDKFDDNELTLAFDMGGSVIVNDVRARFYIVPQPDVTQGLADVRARVISPDGTRSEWKRVSFMTTDSDSGGGDTGGGGGGDDGDNGGFNISQTVVTYRMDMQAEVYFQNDFNGVISTGRWRVQLRDPGFTEVGRCLFRNATLRINSGVPAGSLTGNEVAAFPVNSLAYHNRLPTLNARRVAWDLGEIGASRPLRAEFAFTNSFAVTGFRLRFTLRSNFDAESSDHLMFVLISPSGGWFQPTKWLALVSELDDPSGFTGDRWRTYQFEYSQAISADPNSFVFLGEPAAGTWRLLLWELERRGEAVYLAPDEVVGGDLAFNQPATLELF